MAKNPEQLSQKQGDVLTWVRDGCPANVYTEGWEHRIVARALERRGLVSIGGRGPSWVATITTAGRAWLASPPVAEVLPYESEADQLIEQVLQAGGSLTITATDVELKQWERLVRMSLKSPNRPEGKQLTIARVGGWGSKEWTIAFTYYFEDFVATVPVPVPGRVGKYHPAIKAYLDNKDWHFVSKEHLPRAARILQAIAIEAERRSMQVLEPGKAKKNLGQPQYKPLRGHLWLVADFGEYSVEIKEIAGSGGAKRDYTREYGRRIPRWLGRRSTEFVSTGKFELILDGPLTPYQGQHFRDAKSNTVEDRLPEVFAALDKYHLESDWRAEERLRQEAARQRHWEVAMDAAKLAYVRHSKWEHFVAMATRSEVVAGYRSFLDAAQLATPALPDKERAAALDYLAEMAATIDAQDPLASPALLVPTITEPTAEQLKPFLKEFNPYGPT